MLQVLVVGPERILFEGNARRVVLPGEQGVFEVAPFHRPVFSRLLSGSIFVDDSPLPIRRGVVKVERNTVTALVDPP